MTRIDPVPFDEHVKRLRWKQGHHVFVGAPTQCGKTTLVSRLVEKRSHVVIMVCKNRDIAQSKEYGGYTRYERWPKNVPSSDTRIQLWPHWEKTHAATIRKQREIFAEALDAINVEGNRCVVIDEGVYMSEPKFLNLGPVLGTMFYFGGTNGISMVMLAQRPAWIPKIIKSSATHAYISKTVDPDDLKSLSDFAGINRKDTSEALINLPRRHDYVYVNPQGDAPSQIINTRR
jgi:hypothetical protein